MCTACVVRHAPLLSQVHILLRQGAGPTDCLKAAFSAHVFLHMLDEEHQQQSQKQPAAAGGSSSSSNSSSSSIPFAFTGGSSSMAPDAASAKSGSSSGSGAGSKQGGRWGWGRRSKKSTDAADAEAAAAAAAAAAQPTLTGPALVRETWNRLAIALPWGQDPGSDYYRRLLERSKCAVDSLYSDFSRQAEKQGWKLAQTMLNPKESRVLRLTPLAA